MKNKTLMVMPTLVSLMLGSASYAALGDGKVASFIGDENFTTNVYELADRAGKIGVPKSQPWSSTFWPLRSGSTANPYEARFGDSKFSYLTSQLAGAKANLKTAEKRMAKIRMMIATNTLTPEFINEMAPSEKYDLFLGDHDLSFTSAEWQSVEEHKDYGGYTALWEGTCHGWATAAIFEPRPAVAFRVLSMDGKYLIPFYPEDLKALSTRLWGNSMIQDYTVQQGLRCDTRRAKTDKTNGKVLDVTCQGVNPGDFHVSLLELVGVRKGSFVINRKSNKLDVWNQPVAGYEMHYFNPDTGIIGDVAHSVIKREGYADPFNKYRSEKVKYLVGVEMELKYTAETFPKHAKFDSEYNDKIKGLKVRYDLELDSEYKVIGGEWRNKTDPSGGSNSIDPPNYPGFIWKFISQNPKAYSVADADLEGDDISKVSAESLIAASKKAAQFRYNRYNYDQDGNATFSRAELRPQPLTKVLDTLFNLAK